MKTNYGNVVINLNNMRSTKELLEIVREEFTKEPENNAIGEPYLGLCMTIQILLSCETIEIFESLFLYHYITSNNLKNDYYPYFWKMRDSVPRIQWLDFHIELNSIV